MNTEELITLETVKQRMRERRQSHPDMTLAAIGEVTGLSRRAIMRRDDETDAEPGLLEVARCAQAFDFSIDAMLFPERFTHFEGKLEHGFVEVMSHNHAAFWLDDKSLEILSLSKSAADLFHAERPDAIGRTIIDVMRDYKKTTGDDSSFRPCMFETSRELARRDGFSTFRAWMAAPDGHLRAVSVSVYFLPADTTRADGDSLAITLFPTDDRAGHRWTHLERGEELAFSSTTGGRYTVRDAELLNAFMGNNDLEAAARSCGATPDELSGFLEAAAARVGTTDLDELRAFVWSIASESWLFDPDFVIAGDSRRLP